MADSYVLIIRGPQKRVEKYGEMAEHPIVKMSKSLGNVVNPDDVVNEYGADKRITVCPTV